MSRAVARLLLGAGALLVVGGAWLLLSRSQHEAAARVAALPVVAPVAVAELPDGHSVLLEGRLVAREPASPQGFVVYDEKYFLRKEAEGPNRGREQWGTRSTTRPLLAFERGGSTVDGCGRDYRLVNPLHDWQSELAPRSGDLLHEATVRRLGFKAGDDVTVEGSLRKIDGKSCIEVRVLFGGDHRAYLDEQRAGVRVLRVVGAVLAALGALLIVLGRVWRRAGA